MTTSKTYIGTTKENERVYIEWTLKDGKFTASGDYWNAAGTDINSGGQCIDQIAEDFPESKQAQDILKVWSKYHLNDMQAGTPKQMKALEVIKKDILKRQKLWDKVASDYRTLKQSMFKEVDDNLYNIHQDPINLTNDLFDDIENTDKFDHYVKGVVLYIDSKGISNHRDVGTKSFKVTQQTIDLIKRFKEIGERPQVDHDANCKGLTEQGLLFDHDHITEKESYDPLTASTMIIKTPYKYGSKWLTLEIPANVITEIELWEEVPAPSELTPIQAFINDHVNIKQITRKWANGDYSKGQNFITIQSPFNDDMSMNKWCIELTNNGKSETFDYYTGLGIDTDDLDDIKSGAVASLMSDATIIGENDDGMDYLMNDLGYEDYNEAKKVADGCKETFDKIKTLDLYRADLTH